MTVIVENGTGPWLTGIAEGPKEVAASSVTSRTRKLSRLGAQGAQCAVGTSIHNLKMQIYCHGHLSFTTSGPSFRC